MSDRPRRVERAHQFELRRAATVQSVSGTQASILACLSGWVVATTDQLKGITHLPKWKSLPKQEKWLSSRLRIDREHGARTV